MNILGLQITRKQHAGMLTPADNRGSWFPIIREAFAGAWQRNIEISVDCALAYSAVYACVTLIASDIAKLPVFLVEQQNNGTWTEIKNTLAPVLRKPNDYQNRIKFFEQWILSKLIRGNAYIYKERTRGRITSLYVLDPCRVRVMVSPDGSVFYNLGADNLSDIQEDLIVPASEIIHDMMPALFHPLCGTSPIFACGLAAIQGINIQKNSATFFENMSRPSGVLTAPGAISDETAARLKEAFEANFSGKKIGRLLVAGDGLKYEPMTITAQDSQLIEQLKWTASDVCSCFHVPPYKIGVGVMPTYQNAAILNQIYYNDCLQSLIENIELCLNEGLELANIPNREISTEFDLEGLLRMDADTRYKSHSAAIAGGWYTPNEARLTEDLQPIEGGDDAYLQQQNYSLRALAKRDALDDPFSPAPTPTPTPAPADPSVVPKYADNFNEKFFESLKAGFA